MIQICGESNSIPLKISFGTSLHEGKFPNTWKKANVAPVHKKDNKNLLAQLAYYLSLVRFFKK